MFDWVLNTLLKPCIEIVELIVLVIKRKIQRITPTKT